MERLHLLAVIKYRNGKREVYAFAFDDENAISLFDLVIDFAENPELSFTPRDAVAMSEKIREAIS